MFRHNYSEMYSKLMAIIRFYMMFALDQVLLCKIFLQEYYIFFRVMYNGYMYPANNNNNIINIVSVKIFDENCSEDITEKFINMYDNKTIEWNEIVKIEDNVELLITYEFKGNQYKIIYVKDEHPTINFSEAVNSGTEMKEEHRIFYSELPKEGYDITEIIRQFAGPNHDFYQENNHHIKIDWLRNNDENRLLIDVGDKIIVAESPDMKMHEFGLGDVLKLN